MSDAAVELKTPAEWCAVLGLAIHDPDGWREAGAPSISEPISHAEFVRRISQSTVGPLRVNGI